MLNNKQLLIDCTFLVTELKRKRPPHGIPRVILAYLRHYAGRIQLVYRLRGKLFILAKEASQEIIELLLLWQAQSYPKLFALILKALCRAPRLDKQSQYFLFKLDQNGMKYPNYFKQLKQKGIKTLIMIHDLFPITHPEYSEPNYAKQFEANVQLSLKHASGILCVSENTQSHLADYVSRAKLKAPQSTATKLAPGFIAQRSQTRAPLAEPYFVIISTLVARKNHLLLLYIWRKLVDELGTEAPKLVIIGKRSAECSLKDPLKLIIKNPV